MSQERNIELIEQGRDAALVETVIAPLIDQQMRQLATAMISMYRQGSIDHDMLVGKVAEMTALDNLMSTLENRQLRAAVAAEREHKDAT